MPVCPRCGAFVSSEATFCPVCGYALKVQPQRSPSFPESAASPWTTSTSPLQSNERLEKVLGRTRLLVYVVLGLSLIVLLESLYWAGFFG